MPQPGKRQIGCDVALVQLVEHDGGHTRQLRLGQHAPEEQPFGEETQACLWSGDFLETDAVTDRFADLFTQLGRHPGRRQPGRKPARLQHPDLARLPDLGVQQGPRNPGGFSGPGRGFHDDRPLGGDRGPDIGQHGIDGQLGDLHWGEASSSGGRPSMWAQW